MDHQRTRHRRSGPRKCITRRGKTRYCFDITYNDYKVEVRAAGVFPIRRRHQRDGELEFLMIRRDNGTYEDFGGTVDSSDKSSAYTAFRETAEESNQVMTHENLSFLPRRTVYFSHAKYMLYFIRVNGLLTKQGETMVSEHFGNYEQHHGILRTVHWVRESEFQQIVDDGYLHPRLNSRRFFSAIESFKNGEGTMFNT